MPRRAFATAAAIPRATRRSRPAPSPVPKWTQLRPTGSYRGYAENTVRDLAPKMISFPQQSADGQGRPDDRNRLATLPPRLDDDLCGGVLIGEIAEGFHRALDAHR